MAEFRFKSNGKYVVTVENGYLKWIRKGIKNFMLQGSKGEKSVSIKNISAIQLKEPGLTTGYLQIAYSGSSENKGGIFDAVKDENTILFSKKELKQAKELKQLIEQLQSEMNISNESKLSEADELKKFKELLDEGIITEEEFQTKKKQILEI
jgi:Short C-terminal domain